MNESEVYENWKRRNEQDCSQDEAYFALKAYADGLEESYEAVKKAMVEAIAILDNDLYVSRAVNAKTCLKDALDEYGWPDDS